MQALHAYTVGYAMLTLVAIPRGFWFERPKTQAVASLGLLGLASIFAVMAFLPIGI